MPGGLPVSFTWGNFGASYCFPGLEQFKNDMFSLLMGTVSGNFQGLIIGPNLPTPSQQSNAWLKTSTDGSPIGLFIFVGGQWIWPHPVAPGSKFRQIWKGLEADLWSEDGGDGTNPASSIPTLTTGAFWQIDPDFAFRVPVGVSNANMATSPATYDGNPATVIHQGDLIGEERHVLVNGEQPSHTHMIVNPDTMANQGGMNPDMTNAQSLPKLMTHSGDGVTLFVAHGTDTVPTVGATSPNAGDTSHDKSHQNMPPGIVVGYAMRTARRYLVGG